MVKKLFQHVDKRGALRFFRYSTVGVGTFVLDLMLLFLLIDKMGFHPVPSSGLAFFVAVSLNYVISRRLVFVKTVRTHLGAFPGSC